MTIHLLTEAGLAQEIGDRSRHIALKPNLLGTIPVSYTHLDVYKRQVLYGAFPRSSTIFIFTPIIISPFYALFYLSFADPPAVNSARYHSPRYIS